MKYGTVYLVGAGPGDPGLITVRGRECLEQADVVVYDNLLNPALLDHAPRAEKVYVGKSRGDHTFTQDEINALLVDWAGRVARVVRLKGGDPFVFGRGGEEALVLLERGIPFEVVPGVTAGIAGPAYAGIPVTHRAVARSVTFITAHEPLDQTSDTSSLAALLAQGTFVFYMGVKNMAAVAADLVKMGLAESTPAAVVEWGTWARQRTVQGELAGIADRAAAEGIAPPALLVVGETVRLREQLQWFERRPLHGKRIVVTRAKGHAGNLAHALRDHGADVLEFPTIEILPVAPVTFPNPAEFDWIVFTSVNAVDCWFGLLMDSGDDVRALGKARICAIGPATADAVRARGLRIDLVPGEYVAEAVAEALQAAEPSLAGKRFLLPRGDLARAMLPDALRGAGADVTEVVVYKTAMPADAAAAADGVVAFRPDMVTFTSSSTAENFCIALGEVRVARVNETAAFASIGPITSKTMTRLGLDVAVEAKDSHIPGLVQAILDHASPK